MRQTRDVLIVGGGLAGLTAAYRLASTGEGRKITVFERRPVHGGKARSFANPGPAIEVHAPFNPYRPEENLGWLTPTVDKGYHIFPSWYWELWDLVETIGFEEKFYERRRVRGVPNPQAHSYALFMPPLEDLSYDDTGDGGGTQVGTKLTRTPNQRSYLPAQKWKFWEYGPPLSMLLTSLGLASTSGRTVEHMTVPDYISTRWYNGSERASVLQDMIVKALANPSKHTSAYTMRQMFRRWIPTVASGNSWTPARGPLQQCLIEPIVDACRDLDVELVEAEVKAIHASNSRVSALDLIAHGEKLSVDVGDAHVIMALPPDVLLDTIRDDPELLAMRPLARLTQLRSAPMGAIDLYFRAPDQCPERLHPEKFTREHFSLIESEFGLTGFQISGLDGWKDHLGGAPGLVLQFVVGNAIDIHELPPEQFARILIDEIAQYLNFDPEEVLLGCVAIPSSDEQLTMNDAGTWDKRPPADIEEVENLFLAGDYVKLSVDVAGMEAAVESGTNAARAIVLAEELNSHDEIDDTVLAEATDSAYRLLPLPDGLPGRWQRNLLWPSLRFVFSILNFTIGSLVTLAKWPLTNGRDFIGPLHDRFEDHRGETGRLLRDEIDRHRSGLGGAATHHHRRKGFGTPVGWRDRTLIFAVLAALVVGFMAAWLLPARLDDYDHFTDAISVLGREDGTRTPYIVASVIGWIGMQSFGAVVRKFVPGSQVLTWMFGWLGWLWLMAAVFPICSDDPDGYGTTCGSDSDRFFQVLHYLAAGGMVLLFVLMPALTWKYFLRDLPTGYEANWSMFRVATGWFALAALASGLFFAATLVPALELSSGFGQRLHWSVGNAWIVFLALWMWFRRHRDRYGEITDPETPIRSVDQRSLWA